MKRTLVDRPYFQRPPRFLPEMPDGSIEAPNPPGFVDKPEISWLGVLAPPIVAVMMSVVMAMTMGGGNPLYMYLSVAAVTITLLVSLSNVSNQIRKYKKSKKIREQKYLQLIANIKSELELGKQQQINALNELNPSPEQCVDIINRTASNLWERTPAYDDFLSVRLGIGNVPAKLKVKYSKAGLVLENDPLVEEPERLAMEFERVENVPVNLDIFQSELCGFAGARASVLNSVWAMLLQIATHHSYEDVKIVALFPESELDEWMPIKSLPHLWSGNFDQRYFACGKLMAHQLLGNIYEILKEREANVKNEASGGPVSVLPHFVFIVADTTLLEDEPIAKYLFKGNKDIGISSIFLAERKEFLPMHCNAVITVNNNKSSIAYKTTGVTNVFQPDVVQGKILKKVSTKLAPLRMKQSEVSFKLPKSITLMEMYRAEKLEAVDILSNWDNNKTYKGMGVPIGARVGGELFNLDMQAFETSHGPHGLVAGTTGSGKSELLQSIIISLAMNFHPHDVVFVLIDYKGGGMADIFKGMPHLVGTITNLGGNQTQRALLSIKSELKRRQEVFSKYQVNNIDKFQKLYHAGKVQDEPIPHLIMIADEFAELKAEQPDFMKELVSAARVGRSLGVHLILATQKPAGVVDDQIWSNSRFKICLKVQDEADSRDVIKRPDAARIKEPGRAYIQVGNDEIFEMFQSAWSGAPYVPKNDDGQVQEVKKNLFKVDLIGKMQKIYPFAGEQVNETETDSQLKAMVDYIAATAEKNDIKALDGPWRPPLEETYALSDILRGEYGIDEERSVWKQSKEWLNPIIGVFDDPRGQTQDKLRLDFSKNGNLLIYGASGTGKTTTLQTVLISLAYAHSPKDLNFYIMDFGGGTLKIFERYPHCGGVMTVEDEDTLKQFMLYIFRTMEERKAIFEDLSNFNAYREAKGSVLPAIFVVIDNYYALTETYEEMEEQIQQLARDGNKFGIYMIATSNTPSFIRYKFSVNFKMALTHQLTDSMEYDAVVGRTEGMEPANVSGRGLIKTQYPIEFQTALAVEGKTEAQRVDAIKQAADKMTALTKERAQKIPVMPEIVYLKELTKSAGGLSLDSIPVGFNDMTLEPVCLSLYQMPNILIADDMRMEKSYLLKMILQSVNSSYSQEEVKMIVIDSSAMFLYELSEHPNTLYVDDDTDKEELVEWLRDEIRERKKALIEMIKSNMDITRGRQDWQHIIIAIDNISEFGSNGDDDLKQVIQAIVRKERNINISVIVTGNTSEVNSDWEDVVKAVKEQQCGILLGSVKEQDLFEIRLPYNKQEKEIREGDGYLINKNKFVGARFALNQ